MWGDFFTKPLQGSAFKRQRAHIMNLPIELLLLITTANSQECVGTPTPSYADVVRSTDGRVVSQSKPMTCMSRMSNVDEEEQQ